ncbi:hypothetical protein [Amycolatopsis decaplanina]|uniref:Hydrolase n=1 Tax=Amycolatopsis decaplanina DSM 44594 TaxID=1284240 RepID=M2ZKX2_9PSEU|nr:hypothetical protein [Amycolatopsis decaplanina]EME61538.1 hydrolase [Amycolatopsis decaplanina DSM 44594]
MDEQRTASGLTTGRDPRTGARWVAVTRRHETRMALSRLVDKPDERPRLEGSVLDAGRRAGDGRAVTAFTEKVPFPMHQPGGLARH